LPVIALKILGFVAQSHHEPRRVRMLGLLYMLGVLASFLVLAGIVIAIKAAGQKAGWGIQFSNPQFIVVLTVIVTLVLQASTKGWLGRRLGLAESEPDPDRPGAAVP